MVEECSDSQDRSLTGAKVPDMEHGTEMCGDEIGEGKTYPVEKTLP
jgi:hypothetical protein